MATMSVEIPPKIEVSDLEICLTQIKMGAGIIEFFPEDESGQKRFSFSSMEGDDRRLDETFDLSTFDITKVKSSPAIWLTPHNKDQKSICITFKSRDSYELFLANSSEGGGSKKAKISQSFRQPRKKDRTAKREVETVYGDRFVEEHIEERHVQCVKRDQVNIRTACWSNKVGQDDSNENSSSEEDGGEKENRENKWSKKDNVTMEKQGQSAGPGPLRSDDDISNSDSETKTEEIEEKGEYKEILERAGHLAKDRRNGSKKDQSTQSP